MPFSAHFLYLSAEDVKRRLTPMQNRAHGRGGWRRGILLTNSSALVYTMGTFGISRDPRPQGGGISFVQVPKSLFHLREIIGVELAKFRRKTAIINSPNLVEANILVFFFKSDVDVPTSFVGLCSYWSNEIKSMREFFQDKHGMREAVTFSIHL